jgi:hypothetical protein
LGSGAEEDPAGRGGDENDGSKVRLSVLCEESGTVLSGMSPPFCTTEGVRVSKKERKKEGIACEGQLACLSFGLHRQFVLEASYQVREKRPKSSLSLSLSLSVFFLSSVVSVGVPSLSLGLSLRPFPC